MARRDGQITARGERKWLVRWYAGANPATGKRRYTSKTVHGTKKDAQKYLNQVLRSRDLGTYVEPSRMTVDTFLDKWLDTAAKPKLAARTLESYRWLLKQYIRPNLGNRRLDQVRLLDVQALVTTLQSQGRSARTIRLAVTILGAALKQAMRWGMLAANPAALVELPKQHRREMQALSEDQIRAFRQAARGDPQAALFDFLLGTGCRPGEALAVRWADLDPDQATVTIRRALTRAEGQFAFKEPKTSGGRRLVPLPRSLGRVLREHRARQAEHAMRMGAVYDRALDLVFANEVGHPLDSRNLVKRHFKPVLEAAKLPETIRLYDLRHSHATALLALGIHPKVAAERLGHASTRMTMDTYSHVLPGMQEEATQMLENSLFGEKS